MKLTQRIVLGYYRTKLKVIEIFSVKLAAKEAFELFCTPYSRRKSYEAPPIFEEAEKISFNFQGHKIHGFGWKPETPNGKKILICHGFDSLSYRFEKYIQPLLKEGFDVFAFDAPAHGISSGKTINALLYKEMIMEVQTSYGPFFGIMAHSFGGIAASLFVEELKDNLPKRLVLIAPATETTRSITDFCKYLTISRKLQEEMEKLIIEVGGQQPSWYSVARIIQLITIPTLWLHDLNDRITPYDDMKHLRELNLLHVEFEITEGLGHSLYKDDKVAKHIIEFLKQPGTINCNWSSGN
ncbi:MAG: alpha/beta hydrolase [Segetibacter sp.]|nr:alpha/beta hydrolase [Segetibacter sp.]